MGFCIFLGFIVIKSQWPLQVYTVRLKVYEKHGTGMRQIVTVYHNA